MTIHDLIAQEAADLRAKAAQLRSDAEAGAAKLEAKAKSFEDNLTTLPTEIGALAEDAATKAWQWIKSL